MKSPVFVDHPPMGWQIAFPTEKFSPKDRKAMLVEELVRFFLSDSEAVGLFSRWYRQHDHIILHVSVLLEHRAITRLVCLQSHVLKASFPPAERGCCHFEAAD